MRPRALVAEDEPALARHLVRLLERVWPELSVVGVAQDGEQALAQLAALKPDVAFLDIRMPGASGLDVAARLPAPCHVVFVTAYDHYALEAFEAEAADYLLKPVGEPRLAVTVERLRRRLANDAPPASLRAVLERLAAAPAPERLRWVRASAGETVRLIPVEEVCYFEAADKYTRVVTAQGEHLIRTPIKELAAQLDPDTFWQVHRGTLVNARQIASAGRDLRGRTVLALKDCRDRLVVSRAYAHLFRQM